MSKIRIYDRWGRPRDSDGHAPMTEIEAQAEMAKAAGASTDDAPHGLHPGQIEQFANRTEQMLGSVFSPGSARRNLVAETLPPGASPDMRRAAQLISPTPSQLGGFGAGNGSSLFTTMKPYLPEVASSDRFSYPVHRRLANVYWRLFYKMDPVIGAVIDMIAELPWSDFQLTGEGVDGEIKEAFEYAVNETKLRSLLPAFIKEFLVVGEVVPHLLFDDDKGTWSYLTLHNPDQINVVYSPFIKMDTITEFVPDPKLRELVNSTHPMLARVRETMPADLVASLRAGRNIPLSPVNASFIPRKLHPYDLRGTSIISRLWRALMVEDALFEALIQTARRSASPLKVAKIGDPSTGVIPGPDEERRVLSLLAQAESDPQCFPPETSVLLADCTRKSIGELVCGDVLLGGDGLPCEVLAVEREEATSLIRIKAVGIDEVECTGSHKWPVVRRKRRQIQQGDRRVWKHEHTDCPNLRADELTTGDFVVIPRRFKEKRPEGITVDHAKLLGYYVAEGNTRCLRTRTDGSCCTGIAFSLNLDEEHTIAADIDGIVHRLCGTGVNVRVATDGSKRCQVHLLKNATHDISEWLAHHGGRYARTKRLSPEVMQWPLDLKYAFLCGYVAGDGSSVAVKPNDPTKRYIEASSASMQLMSQVQMICAQLGTLAKMSHRTQPVGSFGEGNHLHRLHIHGHLAARLSRDAWGLDIREDVRPSTKRWWADDDFLYVKITRVERVERSTPVVNLTVTGTHTYNVNGISTRNSWLCYNPYISFELAGAPERVMSINTHYDLIERIKLVALGVSKAFIAGEVSYASSAAGLTVFLQRLKAMQSYFVNEWIIPKFFLPMAVINEWVKPSKMSASGGHVRIKRSSKELRQENRYIVPTIQWEKSLDPNIDSERIQAMVALEQQLGIKISEQKKYACLGLDSEEEQKQIVEEQKFKKDLAGDDPVVAAAIGLVAPGGGEMGGGGGGGMLSPGIPPNAFGLGEGGGEMPAGGAPPGGEGVPGGPAPEMGAPGGAGPEGAEPAPPPTPEGASLKAGEGEPVTPTSTKPREPQFCDARTLASVSRVFESFDSEDFGDSDPWAYAMRDKDVRSAMENHDPKELWLALENWLIDENYTTASIRELQDALKTKKALASVLTDDPNEWMRTATQLGVDVEDSKPDYDLLPSEES